MIKDQIEKDIHKVISNFQFAISNRQILVIRSANANFGDFSTNIAMIVSRETKQSSMESANKMAQSLKLLPHIKKLEVKEPGFINFFIKDEVWQNEVNEVLKKGDKYGSNTLGKGKKARVEFVSANPTGPLHFGNARGGPIGDSLASVLEFSGYQVLREYIHNDVGGQVEKLGDSLIKAAAGKKLEVGDYQGSYVKELASKIILAHRNKTGISSTDASVIGKEAVDILLKEIISDCLAMGVKFDDVYPESEFAKVGETKKALDLLEKKGVLKQKDGATWFAPHVRFHSDDDSSSERAGQAPSDEFLKDRETVVVKSDGSYTYFANDIAYHNLKFKEGADLVVDIFGANHHGHVPRLQAVIAALGYDVSKFHVILYQWVRFKRSNEVIKMSKRAGTFITAKEVIEEVGKDAVRFFILMHDPNSHIDFDLELAREKSSKNPVYYVQYAHARIASILAKSKIQTPNSKVDYKLLTTNYELDLIKQISRLPELVEEIAQNFAVHRLTAYAREVADSFHKFYENCPVLESGEDLKNARLALSRATQITLKNTLLLLGVLAPDKM